MPKVEKDEFTALDKDIKTHIERLKKHPPKTLEALANELSGTGIDLTRDVLQLLIQLRGWTYEQMNALDARIEEVAAGAAGEETVIVPEDAEKLMAFIEASKQLIQRSLELNPTEDIRSGLVAMQELANECTELVADSTLVDEEEEPGDGEEEEDEEEEDEESEQAAAPQLTSGAST